MGFPLTVGGGRGNFYGTRLDETRAAGGPPVAPAEIYSVISAHFVGGNII